MDAGSQLGHYEILEPLGAGGMGEVYRARDTKLDRDVAIKVLPEDFATDQDRLARFEREAKELASLNHANIATIHGLEDADGVRFIAMECVEGKTLAASGRLEVDDALEIAGQIAEALEAAHDNGVIHRDLKPANVIVTPGGKVKVLDFGLAKAYESEGSSSDISPDLSHSPTMAAATRTGVILGTAAYMSPEQARGKPVDRRTDIWAFGCVLYEILTGKRAFDGDTVSDTMAAILKEEPDWKMIPAAVPRPVSRVLLRCLQKDPHERLHDIADARIVISDAGSLTPFEEPVLQGATTPLLAKGAPFLWVAIGILAGMLAASQLLVPGTRSDSVAGFTQRLSIAVPAAEAMSGGPDVLGSEQRIFDLSPDGRAIAYTGAWNETTRLYLRRVDDFEVTPVEGTEGGYHPFFSPDGEWLGYIQDNLVKKVRLSGGTPETITSAPQISAATWSDDGFIYLLVEEGVQLARAPDSSGAAEVVFDFWERRAELRPGQPGYGAQALQAVEGGSGIIVSMFSALSMSANADYIGFYSPDDDSMTLLWERGYEGRYSSTGHLLFVRGNTLFAVRMDLDTLTVEDAEEPVVEGIRVNSSHGAADFDVSGAGVVVYVPGGDHAITVPTWVDLEGNTEPLPLPPQHYGTFRLSPDGRRLAIVVIEANDNIYLYDLERGGTSEPLTVEGFNTGPAWAPDGSWLAFASSRDGKHRIYRKWIDGRPEEIVFENELQYVPYSFSPDGSLLLAGVWAGGYVTAIEMRQGSEPTVLADLRYPGWGPMFSPDGGWIANTSNEAGVYNIYLRRQPSAGSVINLSGTGGEEPVWSPDGSRIFYRWGADWFVVALGTGPDSSPSRPRQLFRRAFHNAGFHSHGIAPDGERLLVLDPVLEREPIVELRVLLDWVQELSRAVPAKRRP